MLPTQTCAPRHQTGPTYPPPPFLYLAEDAHALAGYTRSRGHGCDARNASVARQLRWYLAVGPGSGPSAAVGQVRVGRSVSLGVISTNKVLCARRGSDTMATAYGCYGRSRRGGLERPGQSSPPSALFPSPSISQPAHIKKATKQKTETRVGH